jgi:hypothetical protein
MDNEIYTQEFDPNYYPNYFPNMAPFITENIVAGDKNEEDKLIASYWNDFGGDIFDDWGYFYIYHLETGKYYFPLLSPQNQDDGQLFTQSFNVFNSTFTFKHGFQVQGIFKIDISVNNDTRFKFGMYGNMGSDGDEQNEHLTSYTKGNTNLRLYYVKQQEMGESEETLYSYLIPKRVYDNRTRTYDLYQESGNDENSLMSKNITTGLIVYFSKTNDVKEWVVNDLGITE